MLGTGSKLVLLEPIRHASASAMALKKYTLSLLFAMIYEIRNEMVGDEKSGKFQNVDISH